MNILVLVEAFMPSKISAATMMYDLSKEFVKDGHNVQVVSFINEEEISIKENVIVENLDGIKILRIVSPNKKKMSLIKRGIEEIISSYFLYPKVKKYLNNVKFDLIVEYSPNIMLSLFMKKIKERDNAKSYLILRDIFPAWAKDLGVIKNEYVYKYFRRVEKNMYKNSDFIGVQSPKNKEYLLENNDIDEKKVEVLYNWINEENYKSNNINYREKLGINEEIIFLYGGNIGKAQQVEFLLELAKNVENEKNVIFLIVGDGVEKKFLKEKYSYLKNVIFMDSISPNDYITLLKQCDVGLVNLNKDFKTHNIPGKILTYMKYGKPVLAAINKDNDLFHIINNMKSGKCVETGDIEKYIKAFYEILNSDKILMGANGKKFSETNFDVKIAKNKIIFRGGTII